MAERGMVMRTSGTNTELESAIVSGMIAAENKRLKAENERLKADIFKVNEEIKVMKWARRRRFEADMKRRHKRMRFGESRFHQILGKIISLFIVPVDEEELNDGRPRKFIESNW